MAELRDQRHVTEHVGVAGEIDRESVLELEHQATGRAAVDDLVAVRNSARVLCVNQRDLDAVDVDGAALVAGGDGRRVDALRREPGDADWNLWAFDVRADSGRILPDVAHDLGIMADDQLHEHEPGRERRLHRRGCLQPAIRSRRHPVQHDRP